MMSSDYAPQPKSEVTDLEFNSDTDHRKRRRNRTTQSCLNCHTSKRKCDRKRPCQRCIQLGLTGLCVYEVDDPALRDDPSVDENTRLRTRIAELESVVRELRGKPHPRWADPNFRDGDPNEKWHSRATKCIPISKRRVPSPELVENQPTPHLRSASTGLASILSPIKTEAQTEPSHLYRFSPSPAPRYSNFQPEVRGSPAYENEHRSTYSTNGSYHHTSSVHASSYPNGSQTGPSQYSDSSSNYPLSGSDDGGNYDRYSPSDSPPSPPFCSCRVNPAISNVYISLSQQLDHTMIALRQYAAHPPHSQCAIYRRITELDSVLQYRGRPSTNSDPAGSSYGSNTPTTDSEILTPLSASSGHVSFQNGSPHGVSPHVWNTLSEAGYNSYFPMQSSEAPNIYAHVMT